MRSIYYKFQIVGYLLLCTFNLEGQPPVNYYELANNTYKQALKEAYGKDEDGDELCAIELFELAELYWMNISQADLSQQDSVLLGKILVLRSNLYLKNGINLQASIEDTERAFNIRSKYYHPEPGCPDISFGAFLSPWSIRGRVYKEIGEYSNARIYYEKVIQHCEEVKPYYEDILSYCDTVGLDNESDIEYCEHAELTLEKIQKKITSTYNDIGVVYNRQKKSKEALTVLEKALKFSEKNTALRADIYDNIATAYDEQGQYEKALKYSDKALEIYELKGEENAIASSLNNVALTHIKLKNYNQAHQFLDRSLSLYKQINKAKTHPEYAAYYNNKGDVYYAEGKKDKALKYHHEALIQHIEDYGNPNVEHTPLSLLKKMDNKPDLLTYLASKAATAGGMGKSELALETYKAYDLTVNIMRTEHASDESKLHWIADTRAVYEAAIHTAIEIGKDELAFEWAEKSRAVLLLEQLQSLKAKDISKISPELLKQEDDLNWQLATEDDEQKREEIQKQLSELTKQYEQVDKEYFRLKYDVSVPSVKTIQAQLLEKDHALIEYFYGNNNIYVFVITKDELHVQSIGREPRKDSTLHEFKSQVLNYHDDEEVLSETLKLCHEAYQYILKPFEHILEDKQRWIIIPDGALHNIPFEALVFEEPSGKGLNEIAYLIKKGYYISYANSAKTLLQFRNKESNAMAKKMLLMAPLRYDRTKLDLYPLTYSKDEIDLIANRNSNCFTNEQATKENFLQYAPNADVIHFSTHATAKSGEIPKIYFYGTFLSLKEMYALSLNAQMVSMSACETAMGETFAGEGVMSLSRGFMYCGVPSVITTLSKVDNRITAEITGAFYKNLKKGYTKDEALYRAKAQYLQKEIKKGYDGNLDSQPYYWAASIPIGNVEAIHLSSGLSSWWLLGVLGLLALLLFLRYKTAMKQPANAV